MSLRTRLGLGGEPLYLMDGSAFIFRGFYAFQNMARSDGFPTNVLYIVTRLLLRLLREERPGAFAFIMDGKGPNFRHSLYDKYKANRSSTPEPLVQQLEPLRRAVEALGIPLVVSEGCEADDCIASLAARYKSERPVIILGADKDLKQCLDTNVVLWDPSGKDERLTTLDDFRAENGMEPSSWPDFQALIGDSSDNIPGVPGVGPKTAIELFKDFATLEEIQERFAAVPPKIRKKLEGHMDEAFLYRQLTTLLTDACPALTVDDLTRRPVNLDAALALFDEFELRALSRELASADRAGVLRPGARNGGSAGSATPSVSSAPPAPSAPSKDPAAQAAIVADAASDTGSSPASGMTASLRSAPAPAVAGQGSLLDIAPAPAPSFPEIADASALPAFTGTLLALVPFALASGQKDRGGIVLSDGVAEVLYSGPLSGLLAEDGPLAACTIITPDLKFLYTADAAWKALPAARCFDLSLAAYLLNPEDRSYAWPHLVTRWAEQTPEAQAAGQPAFFAAAHPGFFALALHALFLERLGAAQQLELMSALEMPLIPVLAAMEEAGVRIDKSAFAAFLDEVQTDLARLEERINELAGISFNIRSSQQLADVLFTRLELPRAGKTKGGQASTSQEVLEKLAGKHPIVDAILEYRKLEKLRSTYLEPLPKLADANDRIHTTLNLLATATGRLSSSNPNLQNIPVRGPMGGRMRSCFIAAPGTLLVSADYSQVELRILAHMSADPILIDAFNKGEDIHSRTASLLFDVAQDQVSPDQRRQAKTINFGLVYGMGPQRLGQDLGISMKEAKAFIDRYFEHLGALRDFYNNVEKDALEHGFVTTLAGRRRYIPDINSQNTQLRSQARRQAINARVQGSAADVIKIAMLQVATDRELQQLQARMLLQIHDELMLEVPRDTAEAAGKRLAAIMDSVAPGGNALSVPL
ncbi:DNA polymerase I, partial [Desulfovibrio sp. OttesenSCG-928-I05]|nr:DNA polymerase I [Desulfovibrio sp. OttesenSCG-928-I05]